MQAVTDMFYRVLGAILVLLLLCMVAMVFGNVVLRYGFNSGILISEEISRFAFVWLTFLGAVLTFRENSHLGVETVVQRLPRRGRLVCMALTNLIILVCAAVFFIGTVMQFDINATMFAPVSGLSLAWVYGIGLFTGGGMMLIAAWRLVRVLLGRVTDEEIARFAGEDDHIAEVV